MRERVQKEGRRLRLLPVAAWSLTAAMSAAIAANALFGQPDNGRHEPMVATLIPNGTPEDKGDAPGSGGQTIQLRYDPVVESVQRELSAAGYYKGSVDGVVGRKTKLAIIAYQKAVGLEPDGKPSTELVEHIRFTRQVAEASLFTGTVEAAPDAEARATVRRVQTSLAELAYSPGEITGELNTQTRQAIMAFERDRNMPETGEISDALVAALARMDAQAGAATQ